MVNKHSPLHLSAYSVLIIFFACCLIGLALISQLSVQLFPSEGGGSIRIGCTLQGASAQATEVALTNPIESTLSRLKGIKNISSNTTAGNANITIEADKWTDIDLLRFNISVVLRQLYAKLPQGASYPQIWVDRMQQKSSETREVLMSYTLNGPGSINDIAMVAEKNIRPIIAEIKGVYSLDIAGTIPQQLVLKEKDEVMQIIGITHQRLSNILANAFSGEDMGLAITKQGNFNISMSSNIIQKDALANYPIANKNGRLFTLADVAVISEEEVSPSSFYRINGDNLVNFSVYAEKQVNIIKLAENIKRVMEIAAHKLPKGYELKLSYNSTDIIKEELNKIYLRTFFSIGILLGFMLFITRQAKYMFIVVASLLANVLLSFIFYYLFALEIHLYSLAGITISLGLVIDNSIVVIEDIRHTGRNRIFMAILASTLTSLGALSVIFFLNETQKNNLVDFALAIIVNLLVSLPVAYFFIPAILQKIPIVNKKQQLFWKRKQHLLKFNIFFEKQLRFMLKRKLYFFLFFIVLFGIPTFLLPSKISDKAFGNELYNYTLGSDFYLQNLKPTVDKYLGGTLYLYMNGTPQTDYSENLEHRTQLNVNITMPKGSNLQQMNQIVVPFEQFLKSLIDKIEVFTTSIGSPTQASINIIFKQAHEHGFPQQLKRQLETMAIYAGAADFAIYGVGRGFNNAIELDQFDSTLSLTGYNYNQLQRIALQVSDTLKQNPRVKNILVSTASAWEQKPYYEYVLQLKNTDRLILNKFGRGSIGTILQENQNRQNTIGNIMPNAKDNLPVVLVSHNDAIPTLWQTNHAPLNVNDSTYLRLGNLSESHKMRIGESIVRNNQSYRLNVHYQFIGSSELNQMVKTDVSKSIQNILPFGYKISSTNFTAWGNADNNYIWFIPLVLLIIFIISAVLLESLKQAGVIVLMIPFSFIGVFLCFYLLGLKFDQGAYASLLMLAGLVTNASLYIINDLNFFLQQQKNKKYVDVKLFIKAFNAKVMPIMITTASAILSLLPFVLSGEEKGFWFTLSAGTIGGLVFSVIGVYLFLPLFLISKKHLA